MKFILLVIIFLSPFNIAISNAGSDADRILREHTSKELVAFARQFEGIPYDYANSDPMRGFDCSGFVNFVYSYFNIKVPRTSSQFSNIGQTVSKSEAKPGDIVLFKGSSVNGGVGHLGIVTENKNGVLSFIHSATSQARGIMISTTSEKYFSDRFVKVVRVL